MILIDEEVPMLLWKSRTGRLMAVLAISSALLLIGAGPARPVPEPPEIQAAGLSPDVLTLAREAASRAWERGHGKRGLLTIIDYSLPSTERRLWVLDLDKRQVLFRELVAHGRNSGENLAASFSNRAGSLQSSLGLFLTQETYQGKHGYSLKLRGLEQGFNDRAEERALVIHGAWYVSDAFASEHGRLGRSWGCPALDLNAEPRTYPSGLQGCLHSVEIAGSCPDRVNAA